MKHFNPILILVLCLTVGLVIPGLARQGMFLDGITYATISRNLAVGNGTFWHPHYTMTLSPFFYGHPPLVFGIQALFFNVLGDSIYIERLYSFICLLFTVYGISCCWHILQLKQSQHRLTWLPILLFTLVPVVTWSFSNNLLENTMVVFNLFAVYSFIRAIRTKSIWFIILGVAFIIMAFLAKGPLGLFPLLVPVIYMMSFNHAPGKQFYTFLILTFALITISIIIIFPDSVINMKHYFQIQVIPAITEDSISNTSSRLYILRQLFLELLPVLIAAFLLYIITAQNSKTRAKINKQKALFYFLLGISATLPILLSYKQSRFYLIPAIPFYALAISSLLEGNTKYALQTISKKVYYKINFLAMAAIMFIIGLGMYHFGSVSRDSEYLADIKIIRAHIPPNSIISADPESCKNWLLIAYLARLGQISLNCTDAYEYLIVDQFNQDAGFVTEDYKMKELELSRILLFRKK